MAGVFWAPASQLLVHDIAGRENLHSAVRLMSMSRTLGLLGGPAVGGVMLLAFGPPIGMLLNVLIYVPLTWWLWNAPFGRAFAKEPPIAAATPGGYGGVFATAREIAGNRIVVSMTLLAGRVVIRHRQCLPGADAGIRRRSRPRPCRFPLQHAARRQCGRRAGRRVDPGNLRAAAGAAEGCGGAGDALGGVPSAVSRCRTTMPCRSACCWWPVSSTLRSARWRRRWCSCMRRRICAAG